MSCLGCKKEFIENQMNFLELPAELLATCLSYLGGRDLARISQTCRLMNSVAGNDILWRWRCQREYKFKPGSKWNGTFKDIYSKVLNKYGYLLGLWRNLTNSYGGLIHFWYDEKGSIVGEEWFSPKTIYADLMRKQLFRISLTENLEVQTEWHGSYCGVQKCEIKKIEKKGSGNEDRVKISVQEGGQSGDVQVGREQYEQFFKECQLRGTGEDLIALKWQECSKLNEMMFYRLQAPAPCPVDRCPIQPGFFKGMYGGHGTEIIQLTYEKDFSEAIGLKISGDPNVPAGKVSIRVDLHRPLVLTTEEQESVVSLRQLTRNVTADKEGYKPEKVKSQPFIVPREVSSEENLNPPKFCLMRYHSLGTVSPLWYSNPKKIVSNFVIFDENTFGMLWMDLYTVSLFSRVHETFPVLNS